MRKKATIGLALLTVGALIGQVNIASAAGTSQPTLVNAAPSTHTPNINDGTVYAVAEVGSRIIVGGSFTSVSPPGVTGGAQAVTRNYILAFNSSTGAIDTGFVPVLDGGVESLKPGPSPDTVYVAGHFSHVNGANGKGVTLLSTITGQKVAGWTSPSMNGVVFGFGRTGGHLLLAGTFTTLGGISHQGIGSINATTGAVESYINISLTGHHNYNGVSGADGAVGPREIDVSPDGTQAVVIGNFKQANGVLHDQIILLDLGSSAGTLNTNWNTSGYTAACASSAFDTYMRDVEFAPDGSYFAVVATGGGTNTKNTDGTRSLCDTATRWASNATGTNVKPLWIDYTGNDSFLSVTVTGTAIYVGGHQRWVNNSLASDKAGPGAVPRPGVVALDPVNGMPFAWNPGRNPRGSGAWVVYSTSSGLFMGSDTETIGTGTTYTTRGRIAFFPLAGGESVPSYSPPTLPATIYLAGQVPSGDTLRSRSFTGTTAGATTTLSPGSIAWGNVRGAFMAGTTLFYGYSDGKLYQASFNGATVGTPALVDPYDDPIWSNVDTGSGQTYRGAVPTMYGTEMQSVSGMVLFNGNLYFSLSGQTGLRYRHFEADDGVIGSDEFTAGSNVNFSNIAGMFLAGNTLYYADKANGNLHAVAWNNGVPTSATDTIVSGPGKDGNDWRARGLFALPAAAPTAAFTSNCNQLDCTFDGSGSTAPGGTVSNYAWDFGDGGTATGATPSHSYASAGQYSVTLTVTSSLGGTASVSHTVQPFVSGPSSISFVGASHVNGNASTMTVNVPANVQAGDGMLLFASVANQVAITPPSGWTLVGSTPSSLTSITTNVYSRVAAGGDAGAAVSVGFAGTPHSTVQIVAYRGTNASNFVSSATVATASGGSTIVSPTQSVATGGAWVLSYFSAKSSTVTGWTVGGGQTTRDVDNGSGSGRINSVAVDSANGVPPGTAGGFTGTTDTTFGGADSWTIVLTS